MILQGKLWAKLKAKIPQDLFSKLAIQQTVNKGYHLFYLRQYPPKGNQKLATATNNPGRTKKRILMKK